MFPKGLSGTFLFVKSSWKDFRERYKISFNMIVNVNIDDNTKNIENAILLHK